MMNLLLVIYPSADSRPETSVVKPLRK
jgi:hypothetical protein